MLEAREGEVFGKESDSLALGWATVQHRLAQGLDYQPDRLEEVLLYFLTNVQETMSDTASSYDIPRMVSGMVVIAIAANCEGANREMM